MEKRCATLDAECQNAKSKFDLELRNVRQELSKKTTELDGMILAVNDARQQNTDFQREAEQEKQVKPQNSYAIILCSVIYLYSNLRAADFFILL